MQNWPHSIALSISSVSARLLLLVLLVAYLYTGQERDMDDKYDVIVLGTGLKVGGRAAVC